MFDLTTEDLIPDENVVITMTKLGYIKRMTPDNFKSQNRTSNRTENRTDDRTENRATNEHKHPNQYTKGADDEGK